MGCDGLVYDIFLIEPGGGFIFPLRNNHSIGLLFFQGANLRYGDSAYGKRKETHY